MTRRLYLVAGPESYGNRLLVHTLTTAGIAGAANHLQPWDRPDLSLSLVDAPELITLHRSCPHAGNWEAVAQAIAGAQAAGYRVTVLSPVRPQDTAELSQVARGLAPDVDTARLRIEKAWHEINHTTNAAGTEHLFCPVAELNNGHYLNWLRQALDLPRNPAPSYRDEDTKHRQKLPPALAFTFDWTTCHATHWHRWLEPHRCQAFLRVLTVGAAEGRTEAWLFANLLTEPTGQLVTIEPGFCQEWHARLKANHAAHPNRDRWQLIEQASARALVGRLRRGDTFHVIYLDGNHEEHAAYHDLLLCWQLLAPGGTLIVDDYDHRHPTVNQGVGNALRYALPELESPALVEVITRGTKGQAMLRKPKDEDLG